MDPLSISLAVASLTFSFAKVTKCLFAIKDTYKNVPITVVSMIAECNTINLAFTHLQSLVQKNPVALSSSFISQDTLSKTFDDALTGCMFTSSAIERELKNLVEGEEGLGSIGFRARVGFIWDEDTMNHLLQHLRGQHTAVSTLVTLLQTESLAQIKDMLRENTTTIQNTLQQARSLSGAATARPMSIFSLSIASSVDASSNINVQLQQSAAYQNAGTVSAEELWRRNEELKEENGELRDKVHDLEEMVQDKSQNLAGLLSRVTAMQIHTNELERQLKAATETARQYSAYHDTFRQTGIQFVRRFDHQRREIVELESTLNKLRESHDASILLHLVGLHEAWNGLVATAPISPQQQSREPDASPRHLLAGKDIETSSVELA